VKFDHETSDEPRVGNVRSLAERTGMQEEVCIVTEVWLAAGSVGHFRRHLTRVTELLRQHGVEYAYFGHPFEWVSDPTEDELPTGIQVLRFNGEARARAVVALLRDPQFRAESQQVFRKTRTYLSRPTARPELVDWLTR
jgi:hypothetical protein